MRDTLDLTDLATRIETTQQLWRQYRKFTRLIPNLTILFALLGAASAGVGLAVQNLRFLEQLLSIFEIVGFAYIIFMLFSIAYNFYLRRRLTKDALPYTEPLATVLGYPIQVKEFFGILPIVVLGLLLAAMVLLILQPSSYFIPFGLSFVLAIIGMYFPMMQAIWMYWGPFAKADYDSALRRITQFRRLSPHAILPGYIQSYMLFVAGRLENALGASHENLRRAQTSVNAASWCSLHLNLLANLHIEQADFEKAMHLCEMAARITPHEVGSYLTLAELYLMRGDNPERALELLDFGLSRLPDVSATNRSLDRSSRASWKLLEAQAAWITSRVTRSNTAIELALQLIDPRHLPLTADAYVSLGKLRHMQGNNEEAQSYFQKALTLDPNGLSGQRARKLLDQLENPSSTGNRQPPDLKPATSNL
jgi:tetratricopeptide (TPR) repeat protein